MDAASFIKESGELARKLERFGITKSRKCAVTLYTGDGICVEFDRPDKSCAVLHRCIKNAFEADTLIISYEPSNQSYDILPQVSTNTLLDRKAIKETSENIRSFLFRESNERPEYPVGNFHVVFTGLEVCIGGTEIYELERSAFLLEQYICKLMELSAIKSETVAVSGKRAELIIQQLEMMENGKIYITNQHKEKQR